MSTNFVLTHSSSFVLTYVHVVNFGASEKKNSLFAFLGCLGLAALYVGKRYQGTSVFHGRRWNQTTDLSLVLET